MQNLTEIVTGYRRLGWATLRIAPLAKAPVGMWRDRIDEPDAFAPGDNIGIRLGAPSGHLVDLDLDCDEAIRLAPVFMPETSRFGRASKRSSHWLYICPGARTKRPPGVPLELRSTGLQTVFPGSTHEHGEIINWDRWQPDGPTKLDDAELLAAFARLTAATCVARFFPKIRGDRHTAVLALAGTLWHAGWSLDDALALLLPAFALAGPNSASPHRETAIRDTWSDDNRSRVGLSTLEELVPAEAKAFRRAIDTILIAKPETSSDTRPTTDAGNAELLMDHAADDTRHVEGVGWILWRGNHWATAKAPVWAMIEAARSLASRGREMGGQAGAQLEQWAVASEGERKISAAIKLAREHERMQTDVSELDADPWILNCENGVVDLRTGQLHEHDRAYLCVKQSGTAYRPGAPCPRFVQFLFEVFDNDAEIVRYMVRWLGYCLTGDTSEQIFGVWHGSGANGKSTLIEIVAHVLGDYAQRLSSETLLRKNTQRSSGAASPDIARLRGIRFASDVETEEGRRWDEALIKKLTGGDKITARHLYKEDIEFTPTWKLVSAVNHKPLIRGNDAAIWRRIHLVPFDVSFADRRDSRLLEKLRSEAEGILAMLVAGCIEWQRVGLRPPDKVSAAVAAYRESQDLLGSFLAEQCQIEPHGRVSRAELYRAYKYWAEEAGEYVFGKHAFNRQIAERGFDLDPRQNWIGISLDGVA